MYKDHGYFRSICLSYIKWNCHELAEKSESKHVVDDGTCSISVLPYIPLRGRSDNKDLVAVASYRLALITLAVCILPYYIQLNLATLIG